MPDDRLDAITKALEQDEAHWQGYEGVSPPFFLYSTNTMRDWLRWLVAEVRRLDGMRCETCKQQKTSAVYPETVWCNKLGVACATTGGGCHAWEKRDA